MKKEDDLKWDDVILPFQLDNADVRGRVARLDGTLDQILNQHDYPIAVSHQVAEAALLTALIGQTIKLRWKLSLQIRGDGPISMIATDYFAPASEAEPGKIRAYASFKKEAIATSQTDGIGLLGKGVFAIMIDQGKGSTPYQGITPLTGETLSACAETYFAQSEQLPTHFVTMAAQEAQSGGEYAWRAGGMMVQHMPKASLSVQDDTENEDGLVQAQDLLSDDDSENWNRAVVLMDSVEETELIGPHVGQQQLLRRLFHQEQPRVFPAQPIAFGCTCGPEKVTKALSIYSPEEIETMTTSEGVVTADCQFCGAHYEFDPKDLGVEAVDDQ